MSDVPRITCHNHHQNEHGAHTHSGGHGMGHGSAQSYLRRFWIVTALLIPLALTNPPVAAFLHIPPLALGPWIQFGLATIIFGFALVFFQHAWHEIKARAFGMMTLVSLAVGAGYAFSVVATFVPSLGVQFYLEISTLVWVLLFGHYLEAKSSSAAGDALAEVARLLPKQAHKLVNGTPTEVDIAELKEGDTVLVKPGEKIPADGEVVDGLSNVDESLVSGESRPIEKQKGGNVVAGSIALDGALTVRLSRVGEHSTIGQIQSLIASAQMTKPRQARIADTASAVLTFAALGVALLTLLVWTLVIGQPFAFAVTLAITVLVIACPHALGLAIPTVTTIATSLSVKNGVFIKNLAKIETIRKADYVVFDKTGTLTKGTFGVTGIESFGDVSKDDVLRIAASLEQNSSHVIGASIVAYAKKRDLSLAPVSDFENLAGKGIRATVDGTRYAVGNRALVEESHVPLDEATSAFERFSKDGATTVFVSDTKRVLGLIALADEVKPESKETVRKLHNLGLKVAMLTGDNEQVAAAVARELAIDTHFAQVLPEDKYARIKELQKKGNVVLMVGDGVNDAPALTQADVGIAIGAGTDVAVEAGDVVLTRSNPGDIVRLIILARAVYAKMLQNLWWALGYNILAIPAAAGVFAAWGFFLRPEIGALLMSASTVVVVMNAMSLRRLNLERA
ncbi:MAG: copper-translocating P-type ATPase [Parcubacteria group bacterium 21-54-25]|nr:MAG: copper-translocating P-type ATPase [Parcubacteria group bacterium 20-58-5]OYV84231.1 MAG: copper-translocating P-type ATPase [Parcubacteria group bacterium 21-54-25]HQU08162.1 heavy metal translocating P-type ATPase [Candidatus Paceibacterota bacterium]